MYAMIPAAASNKSGLISVPLFTDEEDSSLSDSVLLKREQQASLLLHCDSPRNTVIVLQFNVFCNSHNDFDMLASSSMLMFSSFQAGVKE